MCVSFSNSDVFAIKYQKYNYNDGKTNSRYRKFLVILKKLLGGAAMHVIWFEV